MPNKQDFENAARLAVTNIINHGDTDIFPFPFERFVFQDKKEEIIQLLCEYNEKFKEYLARYSPLNVSSLNPVNYVGFRWATQIDYIWNAYLLSCVLVLQKKIESARIPQEKDCVFSYRIAPNKKSGALFEKSVGFQSFMKRSYELSKQHEFVVVCDISEFYPRLGHHRLENALKQIDGSSDYPKKIMDFLGNYSRTNSFGLPVGGPAARILSELTINQVDKLLLGKGINFTRFADDYHLYAKSREEAYLNLIFLSEKLFINQGLTLQKSKTRIMSAAEFQTTMPPLEDEGESTEESKNAKAQSVDGQRDKLLAFSLRFDPYSPTAEDDYQRLRAEIQKYDILAILKDELGKTRVHTALTKKLVKAIQYLDDDVRDQAVLSILANCELLYPIFSSILVTIDNIVNSLSEDVKFSVKNEITRLIEDQSHIFRVDIHLSYAIKVLSNFNDPDVVSLLQKLYDERNSPIVRRDIILAMARCGEWYWLSDVKNNFRQLSIPERRAFIVASYTLRDEGQHWRDHAEAEFSPYELVVLSWAGAKANEKGWRIAL